MYRGVIESYDSYKDTVILLKPGTKMLWDRKQSYMFVKRCTLSLVPVASFENVRVVPFITTLGGKNKGLFDAFSSSCSRRPVALPINVLFTGVNILKRSPDALIARKVCRIRIKMNAIAAYPSDGYPNSLSRMVLHYSTSKNLHCNKLLRQWTIASSLIDY